MPADGRGSAAADPFAAARARMVKEQLAARGVLDEATLAALGEVPRERFVPGPMRARAYEDGALSIGRGQTISQPFIVARMTELLGLAAWARLHPGRRASVLDVGTGSGYQAAVLARIGVRVTSIERDADLADEAATRLAELGLGVEILVGDGSEGHAPGAPYDGIVVAAAAPEVPGPLMDQLADGGRLVVPVGSYGLQRLTVVVRHGDALAREALDACVFVPLVGRHGFRA